MGAARTKAGVLASIRALPTLPRSNHDAKTVPSRLTNMTVSRGGLVVRVSGKSPADARRTDGHAPGGLMSDRPKSARAKASRIGLSSLCKFDDLLGDHGRSFVSAVKQLRSVACQPVRRAHGLNDLRRKTPIC
jgi:hypothetical protein